MRDSSQRFVRCRQGCRHWGPYGAAGLLLCHGGRVLLQRRAWWVHHGRTWSVPGGALVAGETPWDGACREFAEELGRCPDGIRVVGTVVDDHGGWAYHTVVAETAEGFAPARGDREGTAYRWCEPAEVPALRLHPGLAASWPRLMAALGDA